MRKTDWMRMTGWIAVVSLTVVVMSCGTDREVDGIIRVGTKNFTEQLILGEMISQLITEQTELRVIPRFNLGGTMICHGALVAGEIDLYPEYTGTALTAVLNQPVIADPDSAYRVVQEAYQQQFDATWLEPLGFNNTYAITVRAEDASRNNWSRISDLGDRATDLRAGFTAEFVERADGYPGLRDAYGLEFADVRDLDPGLMYRAIQRGEVDVICAFATDGRIPTYDLQPLEDDAGYFPPYYAAPVVRNATLIAYPELRQVLRPLAGSLSDSTMQRLNHEVDEMQRDPADVAREFLVTRGFIEAERR